MENKMKAYDHCSIWLRSEQSSGDIFGEPKKLCRIGEKYQAKIPDVVNEETIKNEENKFIGTEEKDVHLPAVPTLDHDAFLLGLYIFGKNFDLVNKFMGNTGIQNVIGYYYGQFHGMNIHKELKSSWTKKKRNKLSGMKIFTGWRLQELFSRIFLYVTDDHKTRLTRATRLFADKQITFETYVFNVVEIVGLKLLVQAIGIGKGKEDLTSEAKNRMENTKPEPPFSSLTTEEVMNLLKYGIGLSKEKFRDLFEQAVWPRLLIRGWKSENRRKFDSNKSKNSLVFLAPGTRKFCPRSQIQGTHYFVTLVDVLNKVALEPQLIEHDQDYDMLVKTGEEQSNDNEKDVVQFMIVDSSLEFLENRIFKMRKMRSLPDCEHSVDDEKGSSGEIQNQNAVETSLATEDCGKSTIFNQEGGANTDQQCALDGKSLTKKGCTLTKKSSKGLASGSNKKNKRKRCGKESASSDILTENVLADCKE